MTFPLLGIVSGSWGDKGLPGSQLGPNPSRSGRMEEVAERVLCLSEDPRQMEGAVTAVIGVHCDLGSLLWPGCSLMLGDRAEPAI